MKQQWIRKVSEPFQETLFEVSWFGPVVSAVLVAMMVELILEALFTWGGLVLGAVGVGLLLIGTVTFVFFYHRSRQRMRASISKIADLPSPRKHQGLIFIFSYEQTLREAVKYHLPEYCWLLVTPKMQQPAAQSIAAINADCPEIQFDTVPIPNLYDTQACYQAVRKVYQQEADLNNLEPKDIISDITGGTKPMTMGMILACLEGDYPIEHVPTEFDPVTGRPRGPLPPIQISVQRGKSNRKLT